MRIWKKNYFAAWPQPVILFVVAVLTFGPYIPWLGYYWDDWAKMLVDKLYGLAGYWPYYAYDRPLSAWTHVVFTPLLGDAPLAWHIFSLLLRWLTAWAFCWALALVWPRARRQVLLVAILFLVYPVFTQQALGLTYHQMWLQYVLFFVSLGASFQAVRQPRRFALWTVLGVACMALQLSVTEYFAGIELLRPVFIWILVGRDRESWRARLLATLRFVAPYLVVILVYVAWRFFFMQLTEPDPYQLVTLSGLLASPLSMIAKILRTMLIDLRLILFTVWLPLLGFPWGELIQPASLLSGAIALVGGALIGIYLLRLPANTEEPEDVYAIEFSWIREAVLVGLLGLLLGGAPAWLIGRVISEGIHGNRHAMAAMPGASLLIVGGLEWLVQFRKQRILLFALLAALAIAINLRSANDYRAEWDQQRAFFWQLYWRAPYIQPDTAILLENDPFPVDTLFSTSSGVNYLYPQAENPARLAYYLYALSPRWENAAQAPERINFNTRFRSFSFQAATPDSLLFDFDPGGSHCLWFVYPQGRDNPYLPDLEKIFRQHSNPARIQAQPVGTDYPKVSVFGQEPVRGWCYYFEKADLARQSSDWQAVSVLLGQARSAGFEPGSPGLSPYEWTPFIEGLLQLGSWQPAGDLTLEMFRAEPASAEMLCSLWVSSATASQGENRLSVFSQVKTELNCGP